jgi:amidase
LICIVPWLAQVKLLTQRNAVQFDAREPVVGDIIVPSRCSTANAARGPDGRYALAAPDFDYMTATGLAAAMAAREVSAVELAQAAIARIERHDEQINAVCVRDFERALAAAREADAARARGEVRPLLGVPMTVKESFNVAGLPTTWGIPAFKDFRASEDAVAVARVKAAGAVILGKTNVPFALGDLQSYNDIYGATNNPWDLGRTPGGSSGGSSAALAAGYGALSLGSDIGGSLRAPAHFCGIYAHKPTFGLLPTRGHTPPPAPALPIDADLSVVGPMARSAADLALMLDVLAGPDERVHGDAYRLALPPPRHDQLAPFRVLVLDTHPLMPTAASVRAAIDRLAARLSQSGAKVTRESTLLPDQAEAARLYMRLLFSFFGANWPPEMYEGACAAAAKLDDADRSLAAERLRGAALSHRDWILADRARAQLRQRWRELFLAFDVVVCPVLPTPAFPHDHDANLVSRRITIDGSSRPYADQMIWPGVATAPGLPATAVPIDRSEDGLPIGVQIIGPMFEDRTPIRFAELIERAFGGFVPPPLG